MLRKKEALGAVGALSKNASSENEKENLSALNTAWFWGCSKTFTVPRMRNTLEGTPRAIRLIKTRHMPTWRQVAYELTCFETEKCPVGRSTITYGFTCAPTAEDSATRIASVQ